MGIASLRFYDPGKKHSSVLVILWSCHVRFSEIFPVGRVEVEHALALVVQSLSGLCF